MKTILSKTAGDTHDLGIRLGAAIKSGISIALEGELGAGKTTFVQGLARGLKVSEKYYITSPTFNIINEYPADGLTLCHLDLYRLSEAEELDYIGFEDLLDDTHVIVVEWPGILKQDAFDFDLTIQFEFNEDHDRRISVLASGQAGSNLLSRLFS